MHNTTPPENIVPIEVIAAKFDISLRLAQRLAERCQAAQYEGLIDLSKIATCLGIPIDLDLTGNSKYSLIVGRAELAARLGVSERTLRNHLRNSLKSIKLPKSIDLGGGKRVFLRQDLVEMDFHVTGPIAYDLEDANLSKEAGSDGEAPLDFQENTLLFEDTDSLIPSSPTRKRVRKK
jgi:hypothetical protein